MMPVYFYFVLSLDLCKQVTLGKDEIRVARTLVRLYF